MTNATNIQTNYQVISTKFALMAVVTSYKTSWIKSFSPESRTAYSIINDPNWYIADFWMTAEAEADDDIRNGRFDTVNSVEELLAFFDAQEKEIQENR